MTSSDSNLPAAPEPAPPKPPMPAPAEPTPSVGAAIGCAFGAAVAGLIGVPVLIFILGLIINAFSSACGTPGDSGGCEMWLLSVTVMSAIPGAIICAVLGLAIGLRDMRLARAKKKP